MVFLDFDPWLPPSSDALDRLYYAQWGKAGGPDTIIKATNDTDTAFFNGRLHRNYIIRWSTSKQIEKKSGKDESLTLGSTFRSVKGLLECRYDRDASESAGRDMANVVAPNKHLFAFRYRKRYAGSEIVGWS